MEFFLIAIAKALILPPGGIITGAVAGFVVGRKWPRVGRAFVIGVVIAGILLCLPIVAGSLASRVEKFSAIPPHKISELQADAIVILAGGKDNHRQEYGGVTISKNTLQRLRYGAKLARTLALPVLLSGGVVRGSGVGEAQLMATVIKDEFGVEPQWVEAQSRNTAQNARLSYELLGTKKIILVTHALHMARAERVFAAEGMTVIAAPVSSVALVKPVAPTLFDFLPSEKALLVSHDALHEVLGMIWYAIRY